jgi:hypothetical protein
VDAGVLDPPFRVRDPFRSFAFVADGFVGGGSGVRCDVFVEDGPPAGDFPCGVLPADLFDRGFNLPWVLFEGVEDSLFDLWRRVVPRGSW